MLNEQYNTLQVNINALAYMNDTTWIANSKSSLENTLKIADEFFQVNSILVNKDKSELLIINPTDKKMYKKEMQLYFGENIINIKPLDYQQKVYI